MTDRLAAAATPPAKPRSPLNGRMDEIERRYRAGEPVVAIAKRFSVTTQAIYQNARKHRWARHGTRIAPADEAPVRDGDE